MTITHASISEIDVSIELHHELDECGEYDAFTSITCDILVRGKKAGNISGTRVNRSKIPERYFLGAMDGHSGDLQYVGVTIFEPRYGRTQLRSLRDGGDDMKFDFLYIETFHIDPQYRTIGNVSCSSDVGTYALQKLLHHPYIKGQANNGSWGVSSCIYILDPYEAMTDKEKSRIKVEDQREFDRRFQMDMQAHTSQAVEMETEQSFRTKEEKAALMNYYARLDANQFLRNGFIQDATVAKNNPRFLVAAYEHWKQPLKSHAEVQAIQFYIEPKIQRPTGKDAEILEVTRRMCSGLGASAFRTEVTPLIRAGGSLARSHALHAACANKDVEIARCILQLDPSCLEVRDEGDSTPLMVAAAIAPGSATSQGIPNQPVIDLLLAAGAQKGAVNSNTGMTAYGTLKYEHYQSSIAIQAMTGMPVLGGSPNTPGLAELEAKLMPPGGPTIADRTGGKSKRPGIIHYDD